MNSTRLEKILITSVTFVLALKLHLHIIQYYIENVGMFLWRGLRLSVSSKLYSLGGRMVDELENIVTCKPISNEHPKNAHATIESVLQEVFSI
jgi:hypothetical protein